MNLVRWSSPWSKTSKQNESIFLPGVSADTDRTRWIPIIIHIVCSAREGSEREKVHNNRYYSTSSRYCTRYYVGTTKNKDILFYSYCVTGTWKKKHYNVMNRAVRFGVIPVFYRLSTATMPIGYVILTIIIYLANNTIIAYTFKLKYNIVIGIPM